MSSSGRAVFLSYASQDAAAAKRICDALRAAGVEVWFDQSELAGGDAWDAKIRGQVGSCALFVPVISASTQARREGYFRIEWKLAAQRTLAIADGTAFLLPVVIDGTGDAEARVPGEFKTVQWTKLPQGETPPAFAARVMKLLKDETIVESSNPARSGGISRQGLSKWWWVLPIFGVSMALFLVLKERRKEPAAPAVLAPAAPALLSEARQLTAQAYAITQKVGFTREELATADALMQKALELEPGSARAQSVRAWVQACYLMRNWDVSERRLQEVQASANRALAFDPGDADALNALGSVYEKQRAPAETEKITRRALAAAPDNYRSRLLLGRALRTQGKKAEALEVLQEAVRRFPDNVLCRYELAVNYASVGMQLEAMTPANATAAIEQLDAAIATQPFASAILMKAVLEAAGRGDLGRMRAELDRLEALPLSDRSEDRAVYVALWGGLLERRPERVLAAAKLTARPYFEDNIVAGPKAWNTALAYRLAGKDALARQEWLAAEAALRQRLREQPNELDTMRLATTLAWQEDNEGAERLMAPIEAAWREDPNRTRARDLARYYAARGDAAKAVPHLREVVNFNSFLTDHVLPLDPWWDKLRGQPEFEALLKEAATRGLVTPALVAPKVDDKSVAVLAFANLSDDKANEYFSDGISEELLNVLAKVPGLKVTARTSSFHFKGTNTAIPEIAQQLGVAYVVEGSVRKAGGQVRITAQLIKAADGFHVWSETFTRDLKDVFAVQDEIAGLIARNLRAKLALDRDRAAIAPEAYGLILQARQAAARQTIDGGRVAVKLYRDALAMAPASADAWAELAYVYQYLARFGGMDTGEGMREARLAARKALELDPEQPLGLAAFGWVQRTDEHDWRGAVQSFRRALAVAPENVAIMSDAAICFLNVGLIDESVALADRAVERDPLNPKAHWSRGIVLAFAGRLAQSEAPYRRAIELAPVADEYHSHLARVLTVLKRLGEAKEVALAEPSERYRLSTLAGIYYDLGDNVAAERCMAELIAKYSDSMAGYIGTVYAQAGHRDEAFKWLERAFENRDSAVAWVKSSSYLEELHDDPRWPVFLHKMGLADEQLK